MGFMIKDKDGNAIVINELDREACEFWNKTLDSRDYATPKGSMSNWFDVIGYRIHSPGNYTKGWNNVKNDLLVGCMAGKYEYLYDADAFEQRLLGIRLYLAPYYKLIDHWEAKGYTPHRTND